MWRSSSAWQSTWFGTKRSQVQILSSSPFYGGVAHLARAPALHAGGRGFDSLPLHHYGAVAQLVRAFGSYPKGQGFDSLWRYHMKPCSSYRLWSYSSIGQSTRLITGRLQVQVLLGPPIRANTQVWLKGAVLKTARGFTARGGSNPSLPAI